MKWMSEGATQSPIVSDLPVKSLDGLSLSGTVYIPVGPGLKGAVLVLPGIGFPRRAYRHLAEYLAANGS